MLNQISNDNFLFLLVACLVAIALVGIIAIVITLIIQKGKTRRTEILSEKVTPRKKNKIIEKQLKKEIENKGNIIQLAEHIADKLGK